MLVLLDIVPYNPYLVLIECSIGALMVLGYLARRTMDWYLERWAVRLCREVRKD